jgi:hypothetical protein
MSRIRLCKAAIATATLASAALFSFGWSEPSGISLSVESAQARVGRPLTPVSVAGVARRQNRRAAYQYYGSPNNIPGLVGGDDAGTYSPAPYYGGSALGAQAAYYGGYGGPACTPGTLYIAGDGLVQMCK